MGGVQEENRRRAGGNQDATEGVLDRVRDVADGLGQLVGQHFKLARLELVSDLKTMGRRVQAVAILAGLALVGYTLAITAVAAILGGSRALGVPLLLIGAGHVVICTGGILIVTRKRRAHLLDTTVAQMGKSLQSLRVATGAEHPGTDLAAVDKEPRGG